MELREFKLKHPIKEIEGFKDYFISTNGIVYSCKKDMMAFMSGGLYPVKPKPHNRGYWEVGMYRINPIKGKKERKFVRVHQLVANAFIPKPEAVDGVVYEPNHINGDKKDNRVENLEWVTRSENMKHAIDSLGKEIHRRAVIYDGVRYDSIKEMAEVNNLNPGSVRSTLASGRRVFRKKVLDYAEPKKKKSRK